MCIASQYYEKHAKEYFDSTVEVDIKPLYERFLKYVPNGSRILDLGCGSGRDSKAFIDMGYQVSAIDSSPTLCKLAREYTGIDVQCADFLSLGSEPKYDAIWACASLLHASRTQLPVILENIRDTVVRGGAIYISFKHGEFEGERDGRYYTDMTSERFREMLAEVNGLSITEEWYSEDAIKDRKNKWYNVILCKE